MKILTSNEFFKYNVTLQFGAYLSRPIPLKPCCMHAAMRSSSIKEMYLVHKTLLCRFNLFYDKNIRNAFIHKQIKIKSPLPLAVSVSNHFHFNQRPGIERPLKLRTNYLKSLTHPRNVF